MLQSYNITFENNIAIVTVCFQVLAIKTRELNSVQSDCSARSNQLENKHAQELTAEREKALQVLYITFALFRTSSKMCPKFNLLKLLLFFSFG